MTWIAAAESLRSKMALMAPRDSGVGEELNTIEQAEQDDRAADKLILESAAKLGLVTRDEAVKLRHIRNMRNRYAHPTVTAPSKEETLAALRVVCDATLSRPPLLRHGYVNDLWDQLSSERHFLRDDPWQVRDFAHNVAHRLHPDVVTHL